MADPVSTLTSPETVTTLLQNVLLGGSTGVIAILILIVIGLAYVIKRLVEKLEECEKDRQDTHNKAIEVHADLLNKYHESRLPLIESLSAINVTLGKLEVKIK
jgi:hypothetical protein